jgi:hypothetical protein
MERESRKSAYRLTWELDHMEFYDGEFEVEMLECPGWEKTRKLMETSTYELPDPVIFYADFDQLTRTDFPTNNVDWPIMSRRMYETLCSVGNFLHRLIPVAMLDDSSFTFELERRFLPNGQPNPEVTNFNDFVAIQLLEESDYFDFECSEYEPDEKFQRVPSYIERYVLNSPPGGFPPLFRLEANPVILFISSEAREALREAGIRGTAYYPLDEFNDEVDIPVAIPTYP